jgi:MFS family permease
MLSALSHPQFRRLFIAQVLSLFGTGLLTIALALKAFEIGGAAGAGLVLSGVFTVKMLAYVGFAPLAATLGERLPVRPLLAALDIFRLLIALALLTTTATWQIFPLVLVFYLAAAAFTPAMQATVPSLLKDEGDYTAALSLSRAAASLESLLSPLLAAAFLTLASANALFAASALTFALSAGVLAITQLPNRATNAPGQRFRDRLTRGFAIYLATPRLRGLLAANLALSLPLAWILVNSVGFAGAKFGEDGTAFTGLMAAYGIGAIIGALSVPALVRRTTERRVILTGALAMGLLPLCIPLITAYPAALALWLLIGLAGSLVLTPGGLLLARSASQSDRPAIFAAQFTLSHAAWLIAYPLAGWLGAALGLVPAFVALGVAGTALTVAAWRIWPASHAHEHPDLPPDHPHLQGHGTHRHPIVMDELHPNWIGRG